MWPWQCSTFLPLLAQSLVLWVQFCCLWGSFHDVEEKHLRKCQVTLDKVYLCLRVNLLITFLTGQVWHLEDSFPLLYLWEHNFKFSIKIPFLEKRSCLYQQWCFLHKMANTNAVLTTLQIMPWGWRSNETVISEAISDKLFSLLPRPLQKVTPWSSQKSVI